MKDKLIIGRTDKIDLPDYGLHNISAKVDTGAFTSSINSTDIKETGKKSKKLHFRIVDPHTDMVSREVVTSDYTERTIKNSFGNSERRYIITTIIEIFGKKLPIEFSLSDRTRMKNPVLLGRKFLKESFIVDVSRVNLSYKEKIKKKKEKK